MDEGRRRSARARWDKLDAEQRRKATEPARKARKKLNDRVKLLKSLELPR